MFPAIILITHIGYGVLEMWICVNRIIQYIQYYFNKDTINLNYINSYWT